MQTPFCCLCCKLIIELIYEQEGEKKEEINGADFTKIEQAVKKFVPSLDD